MTLVRTWFGPDTRWFVEVKVSGSVVAVYPREELRVGDTVFMRRGSGQPEYTIGSQPRQVQRDTLVVSHISDNPVDKTGERALQIQNVLSSLRVYPELSAASHDLKLLRRSGSDRNLGPLQRP